MQKNTAKTRVLVVIPTLGNRPEYLRLALESIRMQSIFCDIALVYPLSKKEIKKIGDEFNVIHLDDPGDMSSAVNLGIDWAKQNHEYIVWIGDDDLLLPDSIGVSLHALDTNKHASVAFGYCDYVNENGKKIFSSRAGSLAPWIMTWGPNLVPMMGLMMRKSSLDLVGRFDKTLKYAMDLDMLLRLKKVGKFVNTRQTLSAFRWHPNSQTVNNRPLVLDETEIIKRNHLSPIPKHLAFLWEKPIRLATKIAVLQVNKRAKNL
jgi:GT2 family glycosyltransferase